MQEIHQTPDKDMQQGNRSWLGWTARILSTLLVAFWLFIGMTSGFNAPWADEPRVLLALVLVSATDVAIAWWRADIGGFVLLTTAMAHGVFAHITSGHNRGFAVAIRAGPFLIVGLLFIAAWQYSGRKKGV